jgi:hypothetical protein
MKLKKANINYKKNKNIYLSIVFIVFVILCILIIMNRRVIKFDILIIIYKLYSLFGNIAWNNRYPIDYPYDRQDIIPEEYMKEFNHICYYRQITGDNKYKMEEMKQLVAKLELYCINNLEKQTPKPLVVLYPFSKKEDYEKMQFFIQNKYPFVIRGGNWNTNKNNTNIKSIIEKYGETTVMFDQNNETFTGKLKEIYNHKAYLSNSTSFMKKHPEIVNKEDISKLKEMSGLDPTISQLFLSLVPNNGTPMHSAFSHNFFFMIEGRKKWSFWHPDYLSLVYPYFPKNGIYFGSYSGIRDTSDPNISKQYRLLQYAPSYEIILEEGDVLFNPGPWWHAIKNITDVTLAVATRWTYKDIFPSPNQLQYCQIENPELYRIIKKIYKHTGSFVFDVDENYSGEIKEDSISLVEILNHDSLKMLVDKNRFYEWHESFMNMFS